ncbi:GntR family transcriptional regulator [Candidatus Leptofilum sp.]|uniref:GntR family transcriptional regulator n=1 Tax=Candidatus Leptofilum sp. TaxID=3241576 RepID=UPI003B5C1EB7
MMNGIKLSIEQVEVALRDRIRRRVYLPGEQLPTELSLTAEFGVSRATVRTVLTRLASEGLIIRRQGAGTYVNQRVGEVNTLGGLLDYGRLISESGHKPTIQPISMLQRGATADEASWLNLELGEPVLVLVRLFLADERPFILATNLIPQALFTRETDFYDGRLSLHSFLQEYCQQTIAYAIYEISPVLAEDEKTTQLLACQPGQPLLQFATTFYNQDDHPIVWGYSTYDDTVVKLRFMQSWV